VFLLTRDNPMTDREHRQNQATIFRALHSGPEILLLPNVWDVASARLMEDSAYKAIATTSAGIAFSLGYPDGQKISREEMLESIARIVRAVKVPLSADVEAGYGDKPEDAALTARALVEAGAVGMNLEDATGDPERPLVDLPLQLEKIQTVRETARELSVPLVLNARTDVYLLQVGDADKRYDEALHRLKAFRDAGADCVFLPGVRDPETIRRMVADLGFPLNILAGPGSPSVPQLRKLGVARVSLGSGPMRAAMGVLRRIAVELKSTGTYAAMEGAPSHAEMNRLFRCYSE
jgi:2-methylisocitrate lyase-like PEP mutase family enzyme